MNFQTFRVDGKPIFRSFLQKPFLKIFSKPTLRLWIEDYVDPDDFVDDIFDTYDIVSMAHHEAWYSIELHDALDEVVGYNKDYTGYGDWHEEADIDSLIRCCLRDIYIVEVLSFARKVYVECLKEYREHGDYDRAYNVIGKYVDVNASEIN